MTLNEYQNQINGNNYVLTSTLMYKFTQKFGNDCGITVSQHFTSMYESYTWYNVKIRHCRGSPVKKRAGCA